MVQRERESDGRREKANAGGEEKARDRREKATKGEKVSDVGGRENEREASDGMNEKMSDGWMKRT